MTAGARTMSSGFAIAMTDLFFSSSGALLLVLAMLRPTPDIPLPVQADILARCQISETVSAEGKTLHLKTPDGARQVSLGSVDELARAPQVLGLAPSLFYTVALVPDENGKLSAPCLEWVQDELVRDHNSQINNRLDRGTARPVFGLSVVSGEEAMAKP